MSSILVQSENSFLADAGLGLLDQHGPPPNYNESYLSISAQNHTRKPDIASFSEFLRLAPKLVEVLNSVISVPEGVQHFIEGFRTVLCQQSHTKQVQIIDVIRTLSDVCDEVYKLDEDLSSSSKGSNHEYLESTEGVRNDPLLEESKIPARSSHIPHGQHSDFENLVVNPKGPGPITYSKTKKKGASLNTGTKRRKSMNEPVISLGTPIGSSEPSSPDCINTLSGDHMDETLDLLDCEPTVDQLLSQKIEEFARESCEQIRLFTLVEDPVTYKTVYGLLRGMDDEKKAEWSSGIEWTSLVTKGYGTRQVGSIFYAMTAMAFEKWHASQVALLSDRPSQKASQLVTRRLIGNKPTRSGGQNNWDRQRKKINTHLARGRKWRRLVKSLEFGILFKNPWDLVKTPNSILTNFIKKISEDEDKMFILKSLIKQLEYLINNGNTNNNEFDKELRSKGYLAADTKKSSNDIVLDKLYNVVMQSISSNCRSLLIHDTHTLEVVSLQRLKPNTWLSDDIIISCLHLSDKLDFVRIGFSVPIHQEVEPYSPIGRPFQRTAAQLAKWREDLGESLVCFFPLFQYNNHFTLLEINYRAKKIFHYDSQKGDANDVKEAYKKEQILSNLGFSEQKAMEQRDISSCGLMVIKHAQRRMMGLPAISYDKEFIDPEVLRHEAISMLTNAWNSGALVEGAQVEASTGRKRKRNAPEDISDKEIVIIDSD